MAAAPVTASPGHQHQYRLAEDRQYHVQAKMVGRLLRGAGEAVKGISSTLAGMPLQKRKLKGVVYGEPGPEKYTRLTVRYLQLFLPISALPAISHTGGHKMELFAWAGAAVTLDGAKHGFNWTFELDRNIAQCQDVNMI